MYCGLAILATYYWYVEDLCLLRVDICLSQLARHHQACKGCDRPESPPVWVQTKQQAIRRGQDQQDVQHSPESIFSLTGIRTRQRKDTPS